MPLELMLRLYYFCGSNLSNENRRAPPVEYLLNRQIVNEEESDG
jgi:hypothetical protein